MKKNLSTREESRQTQLTYMLSVPGLNSGNIVKEIIIIIIAPTIHPKLGIKQVVKCGIFTMRR